MGEGNGENEVRIVRKGLGWAMVRSLVFLGGGALKNLRMYILSERWLKEGNKTKKNFKRKSTDLSSISDTRWLCMR